MSVTSLHVTNDDCLDLLLQKFWAQECVPVCSPLTADEQACEDHFVRTYTGTDSGRFVVRLPFKRGGPLPQQRLSDSYFRTRSMLLRLEERFKKKPQLQKACSEQIKNFEELNHMVLYEPRSLEQADTNQFFLPHHGVLKESSSTPELRTVFNGSAKLRSGVSLNDLLHAGTNLLPHLPDLICAWQQYKYVFSADIEKMFRQIAVHQADWKYQSVLWGDNLSLEILIFVLTIVVFGLDCSVFLANRCVKQ